MGCGASCAPRVRTTAAEPSKRGGDVDGRGKAHWERKKLAATQQWTVNATNAIARHAMAQGLPEPPESFFLTQERLVTWFRENGELQVFGSEEVVYEAGTALDQIMIIEEGATSAG